MVTPLSAVILSQTRSPSSSRISLPASCILCVAKGSSTRIMVLQSSDCCWHHDYCVVSRYMFLGLNFKWKVIVLLCLHDNFIWLQRPWYWSYRWYWKVQISLQALLKLRVLVTYRDSGTRSTQNRVFMVLRYLPLQNTVCKWFLAPDKAPMGRIQ